MAVLGDFYPSGRDFCAARLEDRGFALTVHIRDRFGFERFAPTNLTGEIAQGLSERGATEDFRRAYSEAFEWMRSNLLCAPDLSQLSGAWYFLTDAGRTLSRSSLELINLRKLLPDYLLHPAIRDVALPIFMIGKYEAAIFEAFKLIEIEVRTLARFEPHEHGLPMMVRAFHHEKGPLRYLSEIDSERQGFQNFASGAFALFKNPRSHRNTDLTDPAEAAEILMIASHLLRTIEGRAASGLPMG
jgi:uncharacterized protein (TIGR02391 family)